MLITLVLQHPEVLGTVLRNTPAWVWGLLTALLALGISQLRARSASLARVSVMPLAMTGFGLWGTFSAFGNSPLLAQAFAVWLLAAAVLCAVVLPTDSGARYDAASGRYALPGSAAPLALIAGVFLVKYVVGVDLAMAPQLMRDGQYALTVAALYGAFTGLFVGRTGRLWRLALARRTAA